MRFPRRVQGVQGVQGSAGKEADIVQQFNEQEFR